MTQKRMMRRISGVLTISQLAQRCQLRQEYVHLMIRQGLIEPIASTEDLFEPHVAARVQKIVRLRRDLHVNYDGIAVVLELLERIEVLEARLARVQES